MSTGDEHQYSNAHTTARLRVGLIGNPVAHSFSPRFQQAAFDALNISATYELWPTNEEDLVSCVRSLCEPEYLGANVTIPYKQAVMPLIDEIDLLAAKIGAVNTIVKRNDYLHGYNTDAPGLLNALHEHGLGTVRTDEQISLQGHTAVLLGAGGAARSAAFALAYSEVSHLIILNRHLERAQQLAAEVQQFCNCTVFSLSDPNYLIPHPASIIINATSLGMHEDISPLPFDILTRFDENTFVYDMIYNPGQTRLLLQASMIGMPNANGLSMLLHQGALAFSLWTNQPAPLSVMRDALLL